MMHKRKPFEPLVGKTYGNHFRDDADCRHISESTVNEAIAQDFSFYNQEMLRVRREQYPECIIGDHLDHFRAGDKTGCLDCMENASRIMVDADEEADAAREARDALKVQLADAEQFITLAAYPKRPDGTYNYCREALEQKAVFYLRNKKESK